MSDYRPLFATNLARSGSTLVGMMLSANPAVSVASEPFLDLFRSMRNTFIREGADSALQESFDPSSPIQDYYFTDERIGLLDVIQAGDLSCSMPSEEWEPFLKISNSRTALSNADLVPYLNQLKGSNYKEMFDNALKIIAEARDGNNCSWIGIKESWNVEFFAALARAYPEAKFLIILRDPRATVNSMLRVIDRDPSKVAHALSYVRHWRKLLAFAMHYEKDPVFSERLYVLTHEQVLHDPEGKAMEICDFLGVGYDPAMIDTNKFFDYSTGAIWKGNSSFEEITSGFSIHRAERWRDTLNSKALKMVEFTCGTDMALAGYACTDYVEGRWPDSEVFEYFVKSNGDFANWRSDFRDVQKDYAFELFRHALISQSDTCLDSQLIRRSFLFEDVFTRLNSFTNGSTGIG